MIQDDLLDVWQAEFKILQKTVNCGDLEGFSIVSKMFF